MYINRPKLEQKFVEFKIFIKQVSGVEFTSFDNKYIDEQENYKKQIYNKAVDILDITTWQESDIGSGKIIGRVIEAISIKENNLLIHDDRRGSKQRQDRSLLDAQRDKELLKEYESVLFDFYKDKIPDEESFEKIVEIAGKVYPFLAYLFFIKSNRKYLPVAPETFDEIFLELGLEFRTSHKCSWENYCEYINILKAVKEFLMSQEEITDEINLLDAHSFLWIIGRQMRKWEKTAPPKVKEVREYSFKFIDNKAVKREIVKKEKGLAVIRDKDYFGKEFSRKQDIGAEAENIVLDYEIRRLKEALKEDLAKKVKLVSDQVGLGYDIISYDLDGQEKHIEVKVNSINNSFLISRNELKVAKTDKNYYIYVVDKYKRQIVSIADDIEGSYTIEPDNFRVYY